MTLRRRSAWLGAGAMALGVLCGGGATKSAHAGRWKVTLLREATGSYTTWDDDLGRMVTRPIQYPAQPTQQNGPTYYFPLCRQAPGERRREPPA